MPESAIFSQSGDASAPNGPICCVEAYVSALIRWRPVTLFLFASAALASVFMAAQRHRMQPYHPHGNCAQLRNCPRDTPWVSQFESSLTCAIVFVRGADISAKKAKASTLALAQMADCELCGISEPIFLPECSNTWLVHVCGTGTNASRFWHNTTKNLKAATRLLGLNAQLNYFILKNSSKINESADLGSTNSLIASCAMLAVAWGVLMRLHTGLEVWLSIAVALQTMWCISATTFLLAYTTAWTGASPDACAASSFVQAVILFFAPMSYYHDIEAIEALNLDLGENDDSDCHESEIMADGTDVQLETFYFENESSASSAETDNEPLGSCIETPQTYAIATRLLIGRCAALQATIVATSVPLAIASKEAFFSGTFPILIGITCACMTACTVQPSVFVTFALGTLSQRAVVRGRAKCDITGSVHAPLLQRGQFRLVLGVACVFVVCTMVALVLGVTYRLLPFGWGNVRGPLPMNAFVAETGNTHMTRDETRLLACAQRSAGTDAMIPRTNTTMTCLACTRHTALPSSFVFHGKDARSETVLVAPWNKETCKTNTLSPRHSRVTSTMKAHTPFESTDAGRAVCNHVLPNSTCTDLSNFEITTLRANAVVCDAHYRLWYGSACLFAFGLCAMLALTKSLYATCTHYALLVCVHVASPFILYVMARLLTCATYTSSIHWDQPWKSLPLQTCWITMCIVMIPNDAARQQGSSSIGVEIGSAIIDRTGETWRGVTRASALAAAILSTTPAYDSPATIAHALVEYALLAFGSSLLSL